MSEKTIPDLSGFGGMLENWLATQKKFAPSGQIMAQTAEAVRTISQAQMAYSQAVMRANAELLAAVWEACTSSVARNQDEGEGPSKVVRRFDAPAP